MYWILCADDDHIAYHFTQLKSWIRSIAHSHRLFIHLLWKSHKYRYILVYFWVKHVYRSQWKCDTRPRNQHLIVVVENIYYLYVMYIHVRVPMPGARCLCVPVSMFVFLSLSFHVHKTLPPTHHKQFHWKRCHCILYSRSEMKISI